MEQQAAQTKAPRRRSKNKTVAERRAFLQKQLDELDNREMVKAANMAEAIIEQLGILASAASAAGMPILEGAVRQAASNIVSACQK